MPTPYQVGYEIIIQLENGLLVSLLAHTLLQAFTGAALGSAIGLTLGYAMYKIPWLNLTLSPYIGASQAIPAIIFAPFLILWVGYGFWSVVLLCSLFVFFPIMLTTVLGIKSLDPHLLEAARLDGAKYWSLLWHIEIPLCALPIITGIRNGVTLSITGAVIGEMVMGAPGIGQILANAGGSFNSALLFAAVIALAICASLIFAIFVLLEKILDTDKISKGSN